MSSCRAPVEQIIQTETGIYAGTLRNTTPSASKVKGGMGARPLQNTPPYYKWPVELENNEFTAHPTITATMECSRLYGDQLYGTISTQ